MFIGPIVAINCAAASAALLAKKAQEEYHRGRHAAQLDEPFDKTKSDEWQTGYYDEVMNPSGGLKPQ